MSASTVAGQVQRDARVAGGHQMRTVGSTDLEGQRIFERPGVVAALDLPARAGVSVLGVLPQGLPAFVIPWITYADIGKARRILGYQPATPIEEGIRKFAAWFLETE